MLKYKLNDVIVIGGEEGSHGFRKGSKVQIVEVYEYPDDESQNHYGGCYESTIIPIQALWYFDDRNINYEATEELHNPKPKMVEKEEAPTLDNVREAANKSAQSIVSSLKKSGKGGRTKKITNKTFNADINGEKKSTIRQNVEEILRVSCDARNDDKVVILTYWNIYDKIVDVNGFVNPADILNKGTNTESIRRARQMIQEEGNYLPTDPEVISRRSKESKFKKEKIA